MYLLSSVHALDSLPHLAYLCRDGPRGKGKRAPEGDEKGVF